MPRFVRIVHAESNTLVAEGPLGWSITPFEGNYYISRRHLRVRFRPNFMPGLCIYKFLYIWMDLVLPSGEFVANAGWLYWLPNPLLPFIWYRIAIAGDDPTFRIESSRRREPLSQSS